MGSRILFLESYEKCNELGLLNGLSRFDCVFDGRRFYKEKDEFFCDYDLVVATNYASSISNYICCKCKGAGVRTLFFSDGIFDLANSLRNPQLIQFDRALYGFLPFDFFAKVTDILLYNGTPEFIPYVPERIINTKDYSVDTSDSPSILITTANSAYFNVRERLRLVRLITEVASFLSEQGVGYSYRIFDDELLKAIPDGTSIFNDIEGTFEECLDRYSHVVTTPSSIVVTSMYHDKPTAQLIYRSEPASVMTAWNIPSVDVFRDSFDSYIRFDQTLMDVQRKIASEFASADTPKGVIERALNSKGSDRLRLDEFRKSEAERILSSSFNLNFEFYARKFYENKKFTKLLKYLRRFLRQ